MNIKILCPLVFVLLLKSVYASDLCEVLDNVVASTDEKPPFESVRFFDAPSGSCQVGTYRQHQDLGMTMLAQPKYKAYNASWACIWRDTALRETVQFYRDTREMFEDAERDYDDASDIARATRNYGHKYNAAKAEYGRLEAELKSIRRAIIKGENQLHSRARKFVSSVQGCIRQGKIRGSWSSFGTNVKKNGRRFSHGQWWANNQHKVQFLITAASAGKFVAMEVVKLK